MIEILIKLQKELFAYGKKVIYLSLSLTVFIFSLLFFNCDDVEEFDVEKYYPGSSDILDYDSWIAMYGGMYDEEYEGVIETEDSCFIVVGGTDSHTGWEDLDASLVKVDFHGNIKWAKAYGDNKDDMFIDIDLMKDGNYIAVGWTKSFGEGRCDIWIMKLDLLGNIIWQKTIGGSKHEQAWSVDVANDGSLVICGGTTSFGAGKSDIWLIKLSSNGDIIWQKTYGGDENDAPPGDYEEYVARAFFDQDGNIAFAATSFSFGNGKGDIIVAKVNAADGSIIWSNIYGGSGEENTWDFISLNDDSYLLPAFTEEVSIGMAYNWIVNINKSDGSIKWQKRFGFTDYWSEPLGAAPTSDGGAVLALYYEKSRKDWLTVIAKIDKTGTISWSNEIKYGTLDWPNAAIETKGGTIGIVGVATTSSVSQELAIMHLTANGEAGTACQIMNPIAYSPTVPSITPVSVNLTVNKTSVSLASTNITVIDLVIGRKYLCHN